jgi:hypothetical protein
VGVVCFWKCVVRSRRAEDHRSRGTGAARYQRWDFLAFRVRRFVAAQVPIMPKGINKNAAGSGIFLKRIWRGARLQPVFREIAREADFCVGSRRRLGCFLGPHFANLLAIVERRINSDRLVALVPRCFWWVKSAGKGERISERLRFTRLWIQARGCIYVPPLCGLNV